MYTISKAHSKANDSFHLTHLHAVPYISTTCLKPFTRKSIKITYLEVRSRDQTAGPGQVEIRRETPPIRHVRTLPENHRVQARASLVKLSVFSLCFWCGWSAAET